MLRINNLHTYTADAFGSLTLVSVAHTVDIDTLDGLLFGQYSGDPAVLDNGVLDLWGVEESYVRSESAVVWHAAGEGPEFFYGGKTIQVGLQYEGPNIGPVTFDMNDGLQGDGYFRVAASYPAESSVQGIIWIVGGSVVPTRSAFWTNFIGSREIL